MDHGHRETPWALFHQAAVLAGIWLLVLFVGIHALSSLETILVPLLWAFFFVMGLLPAAKFLEELLMDSCSYIQRALDARLGSLGVRFGQSASEAPPEADHHHMSWGRLLARTLAVIIVMAGFLGVFVCFFLLIIQSAKAMQSKWKSYTEGAKRLAAHAFDMLEFLSQLAPPEQVDKMVKKVTDYGLHSLEVALGTLLRPIADHMTTMLVELIMMLLYMAFWLCSPIEINTTIAGLFKRYILLKGLASALNAVAVWFLLAVLHVDLAVVFGGFTFLLNFIPEVGPFIAALLPIPVILFDGQLERPWFTLAKALGGQMLLKFIFGNIVEVKLIESDEHMRMHPVVILFCVAFFGWIWGPTGMLLSVPIMASIKAMMMQSEATPAVYRDGVLHFLEGARTQRAAAEIEMGAVSFIETALHVVSGGRVSLQRDEEVGGATAQPSTSTSRTPARASFTEQELGGSS